MSITQFAMVEELASLVRDNYSSRHLVLAVEEALINYLQDEPSLDGTLELEPMSSYNRLMIHRLADIFGFVHESVGEGSDRHLVLQQCLETSIPSILVSDILWQCDTWESSSMPYQLLRRDDACTVLKMNVASSPNYVEREAAYLAARERIFGVDAVELKESARQRPRNVPVVARRMIAHALGQKINNQAEGNDAKRSSNEQAIVDGIEREIDFNINLHQETFPDSTVSPDKNVNTIKAEGNYSNGCLSAAHDEKLSLKASNQNTSAVNPRPIGRNGSVISKMSMREENLGAAKRMFAHALGIQASKDSIFRGK